jgi:pyruvate/oxaloacetate carboxyltransferase
VLDINMSTYVGLYVQRLSDGSIYSVQVKDQAGISLPLEPQEYIRRGIKPEIDRLPNIEDYQKT